LECVSHVSQIIHEQKLTTIILYILGFTWPCLWEESQRRQEQVNFQWDDDDDVCYVQDQFTDSNQSLSSKHNTLQSVFEQEQAVISNTTIS
jgi:hypothetical protein